MSAFMPIQFPGLAVVAESRMASGDTNVCEDFSAFQDKLKEWRKIDDRLVYLLNTTMPPDPYAAKADPGCKSLYSEMRESYKKRESAINTCISFAKQSVSTANTSRASSPDDLDVLKRLRKQQTHLRLLQNELNVEQVVQDRSMKMFNDRCRNFYRPPESPPS